MGQLGQTDLELRSRIDLMAFLTSEPAFDFLRTKNTLGYVCFTMAPVLHDYAGFSVIVGSQREKFTVEDVYGKMLEIHQLSYLLHPIADQSADQLGRGVQR